MCYILPKPIAVPCRPEDSFYPCYWNPPHPLEKFSEKEKASDSTCQAKELEITCFDYLIGNDSYFPSESKPKAASNANGSNRSKKGGAVDVGFEGGVRRCTHCTSEKTPPWRMGPLGPKMLCNSCDVWFKLGRLVPQYRPAASPTSVLTQYSNSHHKVMELHRQKELLLLRPDHPSASSAAASASAAIPSKLLFHDYSIC